MLIPLVNEFAVLGTTFFMMAVATLWYSPYLFGQLWIKENGWNEIHELESKRRFWRQLVPTFLSHLLVLSIIAFCLPFVYKYHLVPIQASLVLALLILAAFTTIALFENKSWRYIAVNTGYLSFLVVMGTVLLDTWPW